MTRPHRLLVVEDEVAIRRLLKTIITPEGWEMVEATNAAEALNVARQALPELILLDLGLPDLDGLDLIPALKRERPVPLIVLSSRDREQDKVLALDLGADDYVTKPFSAGELMARIRTAQRHAIQQVGGRPLLAVGNLEIDMVNRHVQKAGKRLHLSPTEFDLLRLLAQHAGRILTHAQILKEVWGPAKVEEVQYLRVYIRQLRQKIEDDPNAPVFVLTEPGIGYRFADAG
ncbi:response regulator [Niveispirillum sp. KHB5.9]|uniref:response regulator n=1 Tax=Niveispirillum sp. KHB5.9 TaxID=3400269 RepID=UPI003A844E95